MSYNLCQQTFVLSLLSNQLVNLMGPKTDTKGNLESMLRRYIDDFLSKKTPELGAWEVVWGPAVFVNLAYQHSNDGKGIADNVTFVARKKDGSTYVVATAGTNMSSEYGKKVEDADVGDTITWKKAFQGQLGDQYGDPPGGSSPCLSMGTALGVQAILSTAPEEGSAVHPLRLVEVLSRAASKGATLIFTGHSLGGALSPVLALALFNDNHGPLDSSKWAAVQVMPSAGATPGNQGFADAFKNKFAPSPATAPSPPDITAKEIWNWNIANKFDIVPLAWIPAELDTVPPDRNGRGGLYQQLQWRNNADDDLRHGITGLKAKADAGAQSTPDGAAAGVKAGAYVRLSRLTFPCAEIDPQAEIVCVTGDVAGLNYLNHWKLQHTTAYVQQIFHVKELFDEHAVKALGGGLVASLVEAKKG